MAPCNKLSYHDFTEVHIPVEFLYTEAYSWSGYSQIQNLASDSACSYRAVYRARRRNEGRCMCYTVMQTYNYVYMYIDINRYLHIRICVFVYMCIHIHIHGPRWTCCNQDV